MKDEFSKKLTAIEGSLQKTAREAKSAQSSFTDLAKSVGGLVATYVSFRSIGGFLKGAIDESLDGARVMAQVAVNVKNAGLEFQALKPQFEEAGRSALNFGFSAEDSMMSLSRFTLITKDFAQAQNLSNIAMDLARSKNISLADATQQVVLLTQGSTREMRNLGIQLDENATIADNLRAVQDQLAGSTEAFAETSAGKLEILNVQWQEMKQQVGDEMVGSISDLAGVVQSNLPAIIELFKQFAGVIATVVNWLGEMGGASEFAFAKQIDEITARQNQLTDAMYDARDAGDAETKSLYLQATAYTEAQKKLVALENAKKAIGDKGMLVEDAQAELKKLGVDSSGLDATFNPFKLVDAGKNNLVYLENQIAQEKKKLDEYKDVYNNAFNGLKTPEIPKLPNFISPQDKAQLGKDSEDVAKSLEELSGTYDDFTAKVGDSLFELTSQHKNAVAGFKTDIQRIKKEMTSLNDSFATGEQSDRMSVAQDIVTAQDRILELQAQLKETSRRSERTALEQEIAQQQEALTANGEFVNGLESEIAEVKRRAGLTDLQRAIEDYNSRRTLATQEYNEKLSSLQSEMKAVKQKQKEEKALYQEKKDFINSMLDQTRAKYSETLKTNLSNTKSSIEKEIQYYRQLAIAIDLARKGASGASFDRSVGKVTAVKDAVISPNGRIITTDPMDYLIATKRPQDLAGGGGVTININTMIGDDAYAEEMGNKIMNTLKLQGQM